MRHWQLTLLSVLLLLSVTGPTLAATKPNVVLVMADDMGYSDLGCYGGEIDTPRIDQLAKQGLKFSQFYNTGRCWPTRAALLTGFYAQQVNRDNLPGIPRINRGNRPTWAPLLSVHLKPLGYRSFHSGKWHIDGWPLANGFDHSYWLKDHNRCFYPQTHFLDDKPLPPVEPDAGYYTATAIADHAIKCIDEHMEQHSDQPFFSYVAFNTPHFPLQAPAEDVAKYRDKYTAGWNKVRKKRYKRLVDENLVTSRLSKPLKKVGPPSKHPKAMKRLGPGEVNRPIDWDELTPEQQKFQADKMAVHAAMVDRIDQEVGRLVDTLKSHGQLENTIFLFLSDNGASAEIMVRGDGHDPAAEPGSAESYLCLGPGWSTCSNTPFKYHKSWVHEGGTATPLVMHWPAGLKAKNEIRTSPTHVVDIVPTILEIAGADSPKAPSGEELAGESFAQALVSDDLFVREKSLWWAHGQHRALRTGDWKIVQLNAKKPWELYNMATDRTETRNLADKHPGKVAELVMTWNAKAKAFANRLRETQPPLGLPGEQFSVDGRRAFVFANHDTRHSNNRPWVIYAPTLPPYPDKHELWIHQQLLDAGVAVAGIDIGEAYGSPEGVEYFDKLYDEMTGRGYSAKPALLARSRGGLWQTAWATRRPERVAGIGGIYPVFDLNTYPGLQRAAPAYGLEESELKNRLGELNPVNRLPVLAKANVPVFIIHGDSDKVVPLEPNSGRLAEVYREQGAGNAVEIEVIAGQGHNHWPGYFASKKLVDFLIQQARTGAE